MEKVSKLRLGVSEFIASINQTLDYAYTSVEIEGEVASFKVNQDKFVFFDLKDKGGSLGCFMTVWQLRVPIEDGMKVIVVAVPKLTQRGKFSLTVRSIRPSGEGSLKKSFELLKNKLNAEGLFAFERKRTLPKFPTHIAVISSTQAAGYADFIKIINDRWGGLRIDVAQVQVQGVNAPDQIIKATRYFNEQEKLPEVLVLIRGGGSADDLSAFNDELLVREIAASRVPTLIGVGHEVDISLADMAADVRAATPSNAAQILVPDRDDVIRGIRQQVSSLLPRIEQVIDHHRSVVHRLLQDSTTAIDRRLGQQTDRLNVAKQLLAELDPRRILARGYALVRGDIAVGSSLEIEKSDIIITAEVSHVRKK